MRFLKKVFIAIPVTLFLVLACTGLMIYNDLATRRSTLQSYIHLAVRDAVINVQTTEEEGLNFKNGMDYANSMANYSRYIDTIENELVGTHTSTTEEHMKVIAVIRRFLDDNQRKVLMSDNGDELFRPIQFGMTYMDEDLFEKSFIHSLKQLIDSNFKQGAESNGKSNCNDALHVYFPGDPDYDPVTTGYWRVNVDGPHVVDLSDSLADNSGVLAQLYGMNNAKDYLAEHFDLFTDSEKLGISTDTTPQFFVYYDITVDVPWGSSTAAPTLNKNFFAMRWADATSDMQFSNKADPDDEQELSYLRIHNSDMVETYHYRYVLLN